MITQIAYLTRTGKKNSCLFNWGRQLIIASHVWLEATLPIEPEDKNCVVDVKHADVSANEVDWISPATLTLCVFVGTHLQAYDLITLCYLLILWQPNLLAWVQLLWKSCEILNAFANSNSIFPPILSLSAQPLFFSNFVVGFWFKYQYEISMYFVFLIFL